MNNILQTLKITEKDLETSAFELYCGNDEKDRKRFRILLRKYLKDINVISLLWAGYFLHKKISDEMPEINREDPVNLVADEILGMSIANYIGGTKAIFNLIQYDTKKPGILSKLEPILDDIVAGLIAGVMTRMSE